MIKLVDKCFFLDLDYFIPNTYLFLSVKNKIFHEGLLAVGEKVWRYDFDINSS